MDILDLLRADGSIVVNKRLAHEIGLHEAIIYSELVSLYKYWSDRGELVDGEWFYCTFPNLEKNTTIKERTARKTVNNLENLRLIESDLKGLPAKKHYRITNGILEVLGLVPSKVGKNNRPDNNNDSDDKKQSKPRSNQVGKNDRPKSAKNAEQGRSKVPSNNTISNNTLSNNTKDINLSISEEIENTSLPINLKKILISKIDRLIEFKIKIIDIELHFKAVQEKFTEQEYSFVLNSLIDQMNTKPKTFAAVMNDWLDRNRKKQNEFAEKKQVSKKPVREEMVPKWLHEEKADKSSKDNKDSMDPEAKKAELLAQLHALNNPPVENDIPNITDERKKEIWEQVNRLHSSAKM